jgi:hypothetical protein
MASTATRSPPANGEALEMATARFVSKESLEMNPESRSEWQNHNWQLRC